MRKQAPKHLDKFTFSPIRDKAGFRMLFWLAAERFPGVELVYVGMDDTYHYLQEWGVKECYLIPREDV